MSSVYLVLKVEQTSQEECMFVLVHLAHDKGWRLVGDAITIYTNPFSAQQEHNSIILPADNIIKTNLV